MEEVKEGFRTTEVDEDIKAQALRFLRQRLEKLLDEMGIVMGPNGIRQWKGKDLVIPWFSWDSQPAPDYAAAMVDQPVTVIYHPKNPKCSLIYQFAEYEAQP